MYVILQKPVTVRFPNDVQVSVFNEKASKSGWDTITDVDVFEITHEPDRSGGYTVTVTPESSSRNYIVTDAICRFTTDYRGLCEIYSDLHKFIIDNVVRKEAEPFDEPIAKQDPHITIPQFPTDDFFTTAFDERMPKGTTTVRYTNPNNSSANETIVYFDSKKMYNNPKTIEMLDECLGKGNYKLMYPKEAKKYIKQRDEALDKENEALTAMDVDVFEKLQSSIF